MKKRTIILASAVLAGALWQTMPVWGQEQEPENAPPSNGQERANGQDRAEPAPPPGAAQGGRWRRFSETRRDSGAPAATVPGQIVVPAGTWITVRVNQPLSSDHNASGDRFEATLDRPVIVDGLVVARRGQMVEGRVSEAVKAGRAKGTSHLGVEVTEMALVDGQQLPIRSQLVQYAGGTSKGRDAAGIVASTGVGAAIGAAADGGFGAGMGAIGGAVAGTVGVLLTRGHPTEIYPETPITFRTVAPLTINTARSSYAFQPPQSGDYEPSKQLQRRTYAVAPRSSGYWGPGWGYGYPYAYPGYYWGPSFGYYGGGWGRGWGGWGGGWGGRRR
ncbi:MAG: hypothetical protein ABI693_19310 [Bryobacteraceae bacterium]